MGGFYITEWTDIQPASQPASQPTSHIPTLFITNVNQHYSSVT